MLIEYQGRYFSPKIINIIFQYTVFEGADYIKNNDGTYTRSENKRYQILGCSLFGGSIKGKKNNIISSLPFELTGWTKSKKKCIRQLSEFLNNYVYSYTKKENIIKIGEGYYINQKLLQKKLLPKIPLQIKIERNWWDEDKDKKYSICVIYRKSGDRTTSYIYPISDGYYTREIAHENINKSIDLAFGK